MDKIITVSIERSCLDTEGKILAELVKGVQLGLQEDFDELDEIHIKIV